MKKRIESFQALIVGGWVVLSLIFTLVGHVAALDFTVNGYDNAGPVSEFNDRAVRTGTLPAGLYRVSIASGAVTLGSNAQGAFNLTAISFRVGETGTIMHLGVLSPAPGEQYWDNVVRTPEDAFQAYLGSGNVFQRITLPTSAEILIYLVDNLLGDNRWDNGGSLVVRVESADAQVNDLIARVRSFSLEPRGIETSLVAKLTNALAALNAGDLATACGLLNDFLNEVRAQAGKKITDAQAAELITAANQIMGVIGCP